MAQRRMFSLKIIDTDIFLDMPLSSQALYFHLSMRADDEGFVSSPKRILKTISCSEDDYKILLAKQFILPFESGVCVIKDWKIHNYIQKDRFSPSIYNEEKSSLIEDKNGSYTKCIQNVNEVDTQVRLELVKSKERLELVDTEKIVDNKIYFISDDKTLNLTVLQKENLITKYTNIDIDYYIEKIITYNEGKPKSKKYKNLNLTLQDWIKNDIERNGKYYEVYKKPTVNNANIEMWED